MKKLPEYKFKHKLILTIVIISVAQIILAEGVVYFFTSKMVLEDFMKSSIVYLKQISDSVDAKLETMDSISLMAYTDKNLKESLKNRKAENPADMIATVGSISQFFTNVSIIESSIVGTSIFIDDQCYYRNEYDLTLNTDYDFKNAIWYKQTMENKGKITIIGTHKLFQSIYSEKYVFSISRCIVDSSSPNSEMLGVILIDMGYRDLQEICEISKGYADSITFIVDDTRKIIYSPDQKDITSTIDENIYSTNGKSNQFIMYKGQKYLVNTISSNFSNWNIIHMIPKKNVYMSINVLAGFILSIGIIVIILAVMVSVFLSEKISRPIVKLDDAMGKIGDGDFNYRIKLIRKDELGHLATGLNKMAQNIQNLININYETKIKQREAELQFLQSQINPHFLYNTLNSIQMKAIINNQLEIAQMVEYLSKFFKLSISRGKNIVTFEHELNQIDVYIKLQKVRYGNRINYIQNVPACLHKILIPKIILQPLIENAIYHGIEDIYNGGMISIAAVSDDRDVFITIEDNGKGIPEDKLLEIRTALSSKSEESQGKNIGLKNIHNRLQLHYGEEYGIEIHSQKGEGTKILIKIPFTKENHST